MDDLCPLLLWKEQYSSTPGSVVLYGIGFGCFTHGWCLMTLKISMMGSLDLNDGEPRLGEVVILFEGSKWIQRENRERLLFEGGLPPILVTSM